MRIARLVGAVALPAAIAAAAGCGGDSGAPLQATALSPAASDVPDPSLAEMEPRVQIILHDARRRVLAHLASGAEWGRYGMILDAHELYGAATDAYRVASSLDAREFRWPYLLARRLELQGADTGESGPIEAALNDALERNGEYAPLHVRMGSLFARTGRFTEARAAFERAEEIDPTSLPARIGSARALLAAGETDAALAKAEACAAEHPDDWETQTLLARVCAVAGRRDEAREAAARARELPQAAEYPDPVVGVMLHYGVSATACYKRARALSAAGDFENALMNLKVVVEVRPDYAPAHARLAWCLQQLGRLREARRHYEQAISLEPGIAAAHRGLADVLDALGDGEEAAAERAAADALGEAETAAWRDSMQVAEGDGS